MRWILLDQIIECTPGESIYGVKCFSRSESFFEDHFHGYPIVPGVLQIEMIAATGGKSIRLLGDDLFPVLGSVKKAKFIRSIFPGDRCDIYVDIEKIAKNYAVAKGRVEVSGEIACQAEILYAMISSDHLDPEWKDPILRDWQKKHSK